MAVGLSVTKVGQVLFLLVPMAHSGLCSKRMLLLIEDSLILTAEDQGPAGGRGDPCRRGTSVP